MLSWMLKKRFVVAALLLGAVGCAKVDLPKLGEGPSPAKPMKAGVASGAATSRPPRARVPNGEPVSTQVCLNLVEGQGVVNHTIDEYLALGEFLKVSSPLVMENPDLLRRAHFQAYGDLNAQVGQMLLSLGLKQKARTFNNAMKRYVPKGGRRDLEYVLETVLRLKAEDLCTKVYLQLYFSQFVMRVDPFATLVFGSTHTQPDADTRSKAFIVPEAFASLRAIEVKEGAVWLKATSWSAESSFDEILSKLEQAATSQARQPVILDLRYAGGSDLGVLQKFRDSAAKGWNALPLVLLTNYQTHGVAAVFAYELADRRNVLVLGTDPQTYGYARVLKSRIKPAEGNLSPIVATLGTELLAPAGSVSRDGFRLTIKPENLLPESFTDLEAIHRAESWVNGFAGGQTAEPTAPVASPAPTDGPAQPEPSQVADPTAPSSEVSPPEVSPAEQPAIPAELPVFEAPADIPASVARSGAPPRAFGP